MTDVALVDHEERFLRQWGMHHEGQHYRADVIVIPLANELPPEWCAVELGPLPAPGVALEDWFLFNVAPHIALRACELLSVKLTPITEAEFVALDTEHAAPVERAAVLAAPDSTLTPADFAGPPRPNRARRRATAGRAKRRR